MLSTSAIMRAGLVLALGLAGVVVHADALLGRARVIDGDSLHLDGEELRLVGIDAPEGRQQCTVKGQQWRCGRAAAETLSMLVAGTDVRCTWSERDHYGRALATCFRKEMNVNAMLVEVGMALTYPPRSGLYLEQEDQAMKARRGVWDSEFVPPWEWRRTARDEAVAESDCPVKGNVNRDGERIYHLRGSRHYPRVRINAEQGDRCFASASAAGAAGFRPARRD